MQSKMGAVKYMYGLGYERLSVEYYLQSAAHMNGDLNRGG